jgi:L-amino acid N-acyltransferase YncA
MENSMKFITCTYEEHACAILEILNEAIINSTAIYDYDARTIESMVNWFQHKEIENSPIVGVVNNERKLIGFATYGTFRAWQAYKYSVEHSVYIHKDHRGKGHGRSLLKKLIAAAKQQEYHTMIGGIDITNISSVILHEKLGFTHVGTVKEAAFKFNRWLDLGMYQLLLKTPNNPVNG